MRKTPSRLFWLTEMQSEVFDHEVMMVNMNRQGSRELNAQSKASGGYFRNPTAQRDYDESTHERGW